MYNTAAVQYLSVPPYTLCCRTREGQFVVSVLSKLVLLFESSTAQLRQFALSGVIEVKSSCLFIYAQLAGCLLMPAFPLDYHRLLFPAACVLAEVCADDHYFCRMLPFFCSLSRDFFCTQFTVCLSSYLAFTERLMSNMDNTHQLPLF